MTFVVGFAPDGSGHAVLHLAAMLARSGGEDLLVATIVPAPWAPGPARVDAEYQAELAGVEMQATDGYSLHTTGYAFDIARDYADRDQALAMQFLLDRLTALNLIAWVREPGAIHVTVSADAARLLEPMGVLPPE